jgi:hypothetical protein
MVQIGQMVQMVRLDYSQHDASGFQDSLFTHYYVSYQTHSYKYR